MASSVETHSRGLAWFFAHSRTQGTCSGQHVVATFYASGRRTASGQTYDPSGYTAAHRTLPFGSRVTLTNPQNGNSITVVINDRGPFTRGVTLDLSRGPLVRLACTERSGCACSESEWPSLSMATMVASGTFRASDCHALSSAFDTLTSDTSTSLFLFSSAVH
jgi:rare lipoprotein A